MLTLDYFSVLAFFVLFFIVYLIVKYVDLSIESGYLLLKKETEKVWHKISEFLSIYIIISIGTYVLPILLVSYNVSEVLYYLISYILTTIVLILDIKRRA